MTYHTGDTMIDPQVLFQYARLHEGMHIADFGCGKTGHIIFPASKVLGETGMIYAIDIMKPVLEIIKKRTQLNAHTNIHTIWTDLERLGKTAIQPTSLDAVFVINTLVQSQDAHAMLLEAKRLLKQKARLIVVDWQKKGLPFGPADERFIDFPALISWGKKHGFAVQEEFDMGPYHHGVVLFRHV